MFVGYFYLCTEFLFQWMAAIGRNFSHSSLITFTYEAIDREISSFPVDEKKQHKYQTALRMQFE